MNGRNRELFAHLAVALSRYDREVRHDGIAPPAELLIMAEFFADCATARQGATEVAAYGAPGDSGPMTKHPLLTKREAAAELRISVRSLERLIKSDRLTAVLVESAVRIRRADLDAYVAALGPRQTFRDRIEEKTA